MPVSSSSATDPAAALPPGWVSIGQVRTGGARWPALLPLVEWIERVIAQPAQGLGRSGALCPYVPQAILSDSIFFALSQASALPGVVRAVHTQAARLAARPTLAREALLLVFPHSGSSSSGAEHALYRARCAVKAQLLERGLTCGEFYPGSQDRSARNPEVRVAESPVPCIALRSCTPHDQLFLRSQPQLYSVYQRWQLRQGEV